MAISTHWQSIMAHRRRVVAQLMVRQLSQRELVDQLAELQQVNPKTRQPWDVATINHDIRALKEQWHQEAMGSVSEHIGQRLMELSAVKRQAWADGDLNAVLRAIKQESELLGLEAP